MAPTTKIHRVVLADRTLEIEGPADPDALLDDPGLEARFEADGYMPYWADLWAASRLLAAAVLAELPTEGGPVLEIGCGLGLVGVAAAVRGRSVVLTDYEPTALPFARGNADRNGVGARVTVGRLDFRDPPSARYPVILGADVLYEQRLRPMVVAFLRAALTDDGVAWIADPDRRGVADWLADPAHRPGLECRKRSLGFARPEGVTAETTVWELRRV